MIDKRTTLMLLLGFASVSQAAQSLQYSDSMSDCQAFVNMFDCTDCTNNAQYNLYPGNTEIVTCSFPGYCPDGTYKQTCSWKRYFRIACLTDDGVVAPVATRIQVWTNSLPGHCYYAESTPPKGSPTDYSSFKFTVNWNLKPTAMAYYSSQEPIYTRLSTQGAVDNKLCDPAWAKGSMIDPNMQYSEPDTPWSFAVSGGSLQQQPYIGALSNSDNVVGVALNGVFLFAGLSEKGYDAFYPKAYGNKNAPQSVALDICMGSSHSYNTYRYYMFSPCLYRNNELKAISKLCSQDLTCASDKSFHVTQYLTEQVKTITPIGIAKDGRVIYGPYSSTGELWGPCDVDICNGRMFGNYYGYVATMFFPYFVGCWGPGNKPQYAPSCSAYPRRCAADQPSSSVLTLFNYIFITFGVIASVLFL